MQMFNYYYFEKFKTVLGDNYVMCRILAQTWIVEDRAEALKHLRNMREAILYFEDVYRQMCDNRQSP